jgi:hypothetical protein
VLADVSLGRAIVAFTLAAGVYVPTVATQTAQAACGVWRWPVKTLSDPNRTKVDFDPTATTVARFRTRTRPGITFGTSTPRTGAVEYHTWKLKARPIQAKLEDDSDIHLVIAVPGSPTKTMIVEFPEAALRSVGVQARQDRLGATEVNQQLRERLEFVVAQARRIGDDRRRWVLG